MDVQLIDHDQAKFDCQRVNLCQIGYFKSKYHTLFDKTTIYYLLCLLAIHHRASSYHHILRVFSIYFPPCSLCFPLFSTIFIVLFIVFQHFHVFFHSFPPSSGFFPSFFPSLHRFFPPEPPPKNAQKALRRTARAVSEWPDSTMSRAGAQGSPPLFRQVEGDFFVW